MKQRFWLFLMSVVMLGEIIVLYSLFASFPKQEPDIVLINELVHHVQDHEGAWTSYHDRTGLDYAILDENGALLYATSDNASTGISEALRRQDTILDAQGKEIHGGKIIITNNSGELLASWRQRIFVMTGAAFILQCVMMLIHFGYLRFTIIQPFQKLKAFAQRVAAGNLDVPLEMDRQNVFGAFTESFDMMRAQLKRSALAEAQANASKKELVAKLSHDIKTPIASIKAAAELGSALCEDDKQNQQFVQIMQKSDQINTLVTDLFTATLEELHQLSVTPIDMESEKLTTMLANADYLHRAVLPPIPAVLLYADSLRLQQVLDNVFANSYKYANTAIHVQVHSSSHHLILEIEDEGGGVADEELPWLKEKFRRGANSKQREGAGLGLYVSDHLMKEMKGELAVENGQCGLKVLIKIAYSGKI